MKKSRFSEQQIAYILKQADDGLSVEEVCRKAGVSQQTYYRRRHQLRFMCHWKLAACLEDPEAV